MSGESPRTRPYRKRARARQEEETRRRIAQAAMELHGSVGPARTTISAVAERAGVQRATVYRHFPDDAALYGACTAHWSALHPPPSGDAWAQVADPDRRLRRGLRDLHAWYASDERMFVNVARDADLVPALREIAAADREALGALVEVLLAGRRERGRSAARVRAAIAHAASFETWRALVRDGGLREDEAVEVAAGMVSAAAARRASHRP